MERSRFPFAKASGVGIEPSNRLPHVEEGRGRGQGGPIETVTGNGIRSGSRRPLTGAKMLRPIRSRWTGMIGVVRPLTIR